MKNATKFYKQLYVGRIPEYEFDYATNTISTSCTVLGFMTPFGTDKASLARIGTVDEWVDDKTYVIRNRIANTIHHHSTDIAIPTITVDNDKLSGFRIDDMRRRMTTSNVVWRVEDPRGFQLELSSPNLSYIIEEVGLLPGGQIPGQCVWGRVGNLNWLIPVNTPMFAGYEESIK